VDIGCIEATYISGSGNFNSFADFVTMPDTVGVSSTLAYSEATYTAWLFKVTAWLFKVARKEVGGKGGGRRTFA
jgi:hypothetical protein